MLELRMCDLGVTLEKSWIAESVERVQGELERRGFRFRPHFWFSDEWFSPDGVPGVAVPFYLAHPRLMRLERSQMLEVEGGTREDAMRYLRHEVGHAIQTGYQLHRLRGWQRVFGKATAPYPETYRPNPASKRFVQHLDGWYAQSHPSEDFAETFAVWLRPRSSWQRRYAGWPAARKLEYVDGLMAEIAERAPKNRSRARPDSLWRLKRTLGEHYRAKRERYDVGFFDGYDRDLRRLFTGGREYREHPTAVSFLRRHRREIRELVSRWTGEYQFQLDQVLKQMMGRCRELGLRAVGTEDELKFDFAIVLTVHTMSSLRLRQWHQL
jgi:hypothetical protein